MLFYQWLTASSEKFSTSKAIVYRDTYLSWKGLHYRVDRRATELEALGIGAGHYAGLMLGNVPDFLVLALAFSKLGATLVPISPTTSLKDLASLLEIVPLRALITRPHAAAEVPSSAPLGLRGRNKSIQPPTVNLPDPESRRRLQGTLLACSLYKREPIQGPMAPVAFLTGISGGEQKVVLRTEENLLASERLTSIALSIQPSDRILATASLSASYGFETTFLPALKTGLTLCLEEEIAPSRLAKLLREQEITLWPTFAASYVALAKMPTARKLTTSSIRFVITGSKLPTSMVDLFKEKLGHPILELYRTTEAGSISFEAVGDAPQTVGTAIPGVELYLADRQEIGPKEIWVRSAAVSSTSLPSMRGPFTMQNAPVGCVTIDGWLRTGDLGYFDDQQRLVLQGRQDDMVRVDEKRVFLGEVQDCLLSHPHVTSAEVRTIIEENGEMKLVASIKVSQELSMEEILDYCTMHLAPHKVPRRVDVFIEKVQEQDPNFLWSEF